MSMAAAGSSTMEPLPVYVQDQVPQSAFDALLTRIAAHMSTTDPDARVILESFVESQKAPAYNTPEKTEAPKPIDHYPGDPPFHADTLTRIKRQIVIELFIAITREDNETIALLIQQNLVTANTTSKGGLTPLLAAISAKSTSIVKELLDFGADPNAFGVVFYGFPEQAMRTPLMHAASRGSLPLVKLLFEPPHSANDGLIAPDGEIALRLASAAGHRAIVDYLPSRRGGGFLRYKTQNAHNIALMKSALRNIGIFIKFFIWHIPKFFLWSIPKHGIVLPVVECCKWCWEHKKNFGSWCKHQLTEMPKRVARFGKGVWRGAKKIPKAVKEMGKELWTVAKKIPKVAKEIGKELWKFGTQTLPRWVKNLAIWLWELVTVRIPKAILIALHWTWEGISALGRAVWGVILKIVSFLHTVLEAIVTFLRNVTLKDIWNAFCDALRAVFVTFPTILWSWIENFGRVSYMIMETLFGCFGKVLWWIVYLLKELVLYVPGRLWVILQSLASSFAKGFYEIRVWISPKA